MCATIACQYIVGTSRRGDIVLLSRSPRKCRYPLFAYPLFKRGQQEGSVAGSEERIQQRFRERPRGVENSGGWKAYRKFGEKPLPKNVFGPPPPTTRFPPPFFWRLTVISLKRKRHRPDQPQFLRPPEVVLESTLCGTFSPPPNSHDTFCPPPPSAAAQAFPNAGPIPTPI